MKIKKICPYCSREFLTSSNARKFCRKRCFELAAKKRKKKPNRYLCQWCGQVFTSKRKKKFCKKECHAVYMRKIGILHKKVMKVPVRITVEDALSGAKKEGLTYGKYVVLKNLK